MDKKCRDICIFSAVLYLALKSPFAFFPSVNFTWDQGTKFLEYTLQQLSFLGTRYWKSDEKSVRSYLNVLAFSILLFIYGQSSRRYKSEGNRFDPRVRHFCQIRAPSCRPKPRGFKVGAFGLAPSIISLNRIGCDLLLAMYGSNRKCCKVDSC